MNLFEQVGLLALAAVSAWWSPAPGSSPAAPAEPVTVPLPAVAPLPEKQEAAVAPVVQAKSALVVDLPSNATLFAKDADQPIPIASLAKLMTALLVVERTKSDEVVTVGKLQVTNLESQMGLFEGEQLRVDDLLTGLLVSSGNDAAAVLARHVAGDERRFTELMNERAREIGLRNTRFDNPSGYDEGASYSTARELTILSRAVIAEERIRAYVKLREATVRTVGAREIKLATSNELLGSYLPLGGLKTGTTNAAGPCLVSWVNAGERQLLAVVLNSPDRFQESKSMLDWSLRAYRW